MSGVGREHATDRQGVFGVALASRASFDIPLAGRIEEGAPTVHFELVDAPPVDGWEACEPLYDDGRRTADGEPVGRVVMLPTCSVLRFAGVAEFYLYPDRIACHLRDPDFAFAIELWLFGPVLAFWLESRGTPVLHASSVEIGQHCAGFLGTNRGGKSSLAAAFLQSGRRLVSDDLVPVRASADAVEAAPGYPRMRMWPDQARHFVGDTAGLRRVQPDTEKLWIPIGPDGFGDFCEEARPLAALYLPERVETDPSAAIEIVPVPPGEALMCLVRHAFLHGIAERMGQGPARFHTLAEVVRRVPVRRLRYPSGVERLPDVVDAVVEDSSRDA